MQVEEWIPCDVCTIRFPLEQMHSLEDGGWECDVCFKAAQEDAKCNTEEKP